MERKLTHCARDAFIASSSALIGWGYSLHMFRSRNTDGSQSSNSSTETIYSTFNTVIDFFFLYLHSRSSFVVEWLFKNECSSNQRRGRTHGVFDKCCLDARSRPKAERYISQSKQLDNFFQLLSPLAGFIYRLSHGFFLHIKYATIDYTSARSQMEKCNCYSRSPF